MTDQAQKDDNREGPEATDTASRPRTGACNPNEAQSSTATEVPRGHETLLIVSENPDTRDSLGALVRALGYRVLLAKSAQHALHMLQQNSVDLVLSGKAMNSASGSELATLARKIQPNVPVLLVADDAEVSGSRAARGTDDFNAVSGPCTTLDLATQICEILDG